MGSVIIKRINDISKQKILENKIKKIYEQNFDANFESSWNDIISNINNNYMNILVYFENEKLIGIVIISNHNKYNKFIHLEYICISRKYQGKGYGSKIFKILLDILKNKTKLLSLECKYELIKWYNKLGCELISITPSVYDNITNTIFYFMIYKFNDNNIKDIEVYWNKFRNTLWKVKLICKYENFELWSD